MLETVRAKGYTASLDPPAAPTTSSARLSEEARAALDVRTVSHGEEIVVNEYLVPGKFTILDYYADWCGPCLLLGHELEQVLAQREDVAVRKVDLVSWETDAAKQVTREFGIRGIPYVRVYGPKGRFLGAVNGNDIGKVRALLVSAPQEVIDEEGSCSGGGRSRPGSRRARCALHGE